MTEEEAKTKWCPFSRALMFDNRTLDAKSVSMTGGVNRVIGKHIVNADAAPTNCIASACMAWRWHEQRSAGLVVPTEHVQWMHAGTSYAIEPRRPAYLTDEWHWDQRRGVWIVGDQFEDRGYCGLAGQP